ncbi:hypothetical protein GCM10010430_80430 [Kitasatospora cystarginea]|uniref:Peptidase M48 domain-containing protein n=1 Tax=Kitasatospora cystarginea TaxID=58350 RepID=A0ABN3F423_9ACTN
MALTSDEVAARVRNAAIFADDDYNPPAACDWPDGYEALLAATTKLLKAYPNVANRLGYSWATERAAYRTSMDVIFQYHVLELIADVDPGHPHLVDARPVAARAAVNRDFISYAQPSGDLDFIFVSRGFMDIVQYFLEMSVSIMKLDPSQKNRISLWGPANLTKIRTRRPKRVAKIVNDFVLQAIKVARGETPAQQPSIIRDLTFMPNLMWATYDAVGSFVVAHELAHLLRRHDLRDTSLAKELDADRAAISLQLARGGTAKRMDGSATIASLGISLGGPTFYALGGLYYLISALAHWTRGEPIKPYQEKLAHLKVRWDQYRQYLADQSSLSGYPDITPILHKNAAGVYQIASLCAEGLNSYSKQFSLEAHGKEVPFMPEGFFEGFWGK